MKLVVLEGIKQSSNISLTQKRYIVEFGDLYYSLGVVSLLQKLGWPNVCDEPLNH